MPRSGSRDNAGAEQVESTTRTLLVTSRGSAGDEGQRVLELLAGSGIEAEICSPDDVEQRPRSVRPGFFKRFLFDLRYLRLIVRLLPHFNILHIFCGSGRTMARFVFPAVLIGKFFGKRVILDYRSPLLLYRRAGRSTLLARMWRLCDRVVVPSVYLEQLVKSLGGRAVYQQPLLHLKDIQPRVLTRLQPQMVVCADLEREHNVACAIRAFDLVKRKYPRTEMSIVGRGSQQMGLENLVASRRLHGVCFVDDRGNHKRHEALAAADLYINCSSVDCLSEATIEAFAGGLPVVTTPTGGGSEIWRDRRDVMRVTFNDHVGMADRIIELIEDPALTEKLSRRSREIADRLLQISSKSSYSGLYRDLGHQSY